MSVVVSTFPSLNAFSARSWTLAAIIALHAGFFWLLSSGGMSVILPPPPKGIDVIDLKTVKSQPPPERPIVVDEFPSPIREIPIPPQPRPLVFDEQENVIRGEEWVGPPPTPVKPAVPEPAITQPMADPRLGLSEPSYPASERRDGHEGTVLLAFEVLENGRVGQVRIEQSSGRERLDEAAVRQASRWRFKPGTRDGVPVAMWKRIPVHFRLTDAGERF